MLRPYLLVAVTLLAGACSADNSQPPPGTASIAPSGLGSTPTSPGSTPTSPGSTPISPGKTAIPAWTQVLRQPVDGQHVVTQQRHYLVTRSSDEAGTTTVTDRATRRVVVRHAPPSGFVAQSPVVIDDRWALIEEVRSDGPSPDIRAYRYNLTSGAKEDLAKVKGLPRITEPEIGSYDGTYAYSTTDSQRRSCLVLAELATLKTRSVSCVADPGYLADPVLSADSVTFSEITGPETAKRCKRILTAALTGGPARPVAAAKNCIQWSGASLRGATVWSEVGATDPDQYQSKAHLRDSVGGPARSLGPIVTDTIVACGNWIHWVVRTIVNGAEHYEIQRWRNGLARPQRIYTTPPDTSITAPSCQDGKLLVEAAHLGSSTKYTEALLTDAG
ncbi:MAG TPA: hypothetical protein VGD71_29525 [Kribbella sp.]|jgi:hypothetical protein